jgi:NAD(P)H-flavin reductase
MPLSADKHLSARILERRDLSPDLWLLRLELAAPFKFLAGQYATLGIRKQKDRKIVLDCRPLRRRLSFC